MNRRILLVACTLLPLPALADTRDDVLSGIQRCQSIADDRTWLDCTYGAQQPMRAKLGLPPAPDFQQRLVPPAAGAPPAAALPARAASAPSPRRGASFLQILTGSAAPVAVSTLSALRYDSSGAFVVTLDNGQVWHQVDDNSGTRARLTLGAKVTIKPGALGSYNMTTATTSHVYKVERKS